MITIARALAVAIVLSFGLGSVASARQATPSPDFVAVDAGTCTVEPRTAEEIAALAGTPAASPAVTEPVASPAAMGSPTPAGEAADEETVRAITETVAEIYACFEAGEPLRVAALISDEALGQFLAFYPEARGAEGVAGAIDGPGRREAFRIDAVRTIPGDRVAADIAFRVSEGIYGQTWIFIRESDRYLLDEIEGLEAPPTPEA